MFTPSEPSGNELPLVAGQGLAHTPPTTGGHGARKVPTSAATPTVARPSCCASGETDLPIFHEGRGMADSAIFIGWGRNIPGREQASQTLFNEVLAYYTGLQKRGETRG